MKKVLIVLVVLVLLVVGGAAAFVATFDANRYKGQITAAASKAVGRPVTIGRVGLGWRSGIAFEVRDLAVQAESGEPGLSLAMASAGVKLMPLLQKDVQITSIVLEKPYVSIEKLPDGRMIVGGIDLSKLSSPPQSTGSGASSPSKEELKLSIDSVAVRDGRVVYRDRAAAQPMTIEASDIDVDVKNFSLTGPFDLQAAASVMSNKQNVRISGKAWLPAGGKPAGVKDFSAQTDLGDIDFRRLAEAVPTIGEMPFKERPRGVLAVRAERLDFDPASLDRAQAEVTLKEGRFTVPGPEIPLQNIDLLATVGSDQVVIDHLTFGVAGGEVRLASKTTGLKSQTVTGIRLAAKNVSIADLMKSAAPNSPQLTGHLSLEAEAQAQGKSWPEISGSMNGAARAIVNDGVLLNYNLLSEVVKKLSVIPGAEDAFQRNFPELYKKRLSERSTLLKPLDVTARIVGGTFIFDQIQIDTDFALVSGAGQLGLDRRLSGRANLILNEEISRAMSGAVSALEVLYNNRREIVIPVALEGQVPEVKIVPDRQYLVQKLVAGQAGTFVQDLAKDPGGSVEKIEDILKKNLKGLNI